jgi:hypothetical protein
LGLLGAGGFAGVVGVVEPVLGVEDPDSDFALVFVVLVPPPPVVPVVEDDDVLLEALATAAL